MEFVRSNQLLRALTDTSCIVGRRKLRTNGRVEDVLQHEREFLAAVQRFMLHEALHQGLRHAGIHSIHAHLVAVVGGPSQSQFRQVACSDDDATHLVADVHEYLRAFARLTVFIDHIVHGAIMSNVFEVLCHTCCDGHLAHRDTE